MPESATASALAKEILDELGIEVIERRGTVRVWCNGRPYVFNQTPTRLLDLVCQWQHLPRRQRVA